MHAPLVDAHPLEESQRAPALQSFRGRRRQEHQHFALMALQLAWFPVDHAENSDPLAAREGNRRTGVETNGGLAGDQRIVREADIHGGIEDL